MKTVVGRDSLAKGDRPVAVAIGTFDGVHVGHRALIGRAVERARQEDHIATVLTWDRHPSATLRPDEVPPQLTAARRPMNGGA